ncbi:rhamnose/proton symporter RhaT [Flammeovirga yaeyamensis]|uniref:Rhamnose/proton symporter RhaT n=1 Tax=Flammeovirga yaeyamensis TaxID=367791 RepID=A0AAX1NEN8_9BACT|nr:L-rhamnose/proton symporter RhaT [Flammeovirga yaeyamensis]MBB3696965.1 L-rhamnose-H+ transport protein [Flammeovirga yaeyamensis]NMF33628.1 rhamnose/proton symporter RhaT [Flammeovirga yaeyamensis]QWG05105.1 rhamnose/proton symporter RhaT [Flammeovirga yaeyamensis]
MIEGVLWSIFAGLMLGLYALPEKFTKEFEFENTWGLFFAINTFIIPNIAVYFLVDNFGDILAAVPTNVMIGMAVASFLWGIGVMMWGKAINYIGLSLGFSLFIGTIILIGSLIPFMIDGIPEFQVFATIMLGILIVLFGVMSNGRAGLLKQKEDDKGEEVKSDNMITGISIAVVGGLLATGFNYANSVGAGVIHEASVAAGNPEWVSAIIVMYIIYVFGGISIASYFSYQLTKKKLWSNFVTPQFPRNTVLATVMGIFNFSASALFGFAAFTLGSTGGTVGYAIFNTVSVGVAIVGGIITKEWITAPKKAKTSLYLGLACMIVGITVIAFGNSLGTV